MSVLNDASTPLRWTGTPADGVSITSASFTPPNNSLLLLCLNADSSLTLDLTITISNSGTALTWTKRVERQSTETTTGGYAGIYTAPMTAGAAITVSVTRTGNNGATNRLSCKLYVLTGVDLAGTPLDAIGASNEGGSTGTTLTTTSLTPGANGLLFVVDTDFNAKGALTSSDLTIDHEEDVSQIDCASGYKTCSSGVAVTGSFTAGAAGPQHKWVQVIVRELATAAGDTYQQAIQGTAAVGKAARTLARTALIATALLWNPAIDVSGPLPPQPDTYQPPIAGATASLGQAQRSQRQLARIAAPLGWTLPQDVSGPLPVQPDTWIQPVQGTAELGQAKRAYTAVAGDASLGWNAGTELNGPPPDTYAQPTAGVSELAQSLTAYARRAGQAATFGWTLPGDTSGPQPAQPITYIQPIAGTFELTQSATAYRSRALAAWQGWTPAQDPPPAGVPDTITPATVGTRAIGATQRLAWLRAAQASALVWTTAPGDVSGPLSAQPDTYVPPVQGTSSVGVANRAFTSRAGQVALGFNPGTDLSGPIGPQPDTAIQPVAGVAELGQAAAAFKARAQAAALGWSPSQDQPPQTVVAPPPQPIVGTTGLQAAQRTYARAVIAATDLGWSQPGDLSTASPQPDTAIQPVAGVRALESVQRSGRQRARSAATALGWTSAQSSQSFAPVFPSPPIPVGIDATPGPIACGIDATPGPTPVGIDAGSVIVVGVDAVAAAIPVGIDAQPGPFVVGIDAI